MSSSHEKPPGSPPITRRQALAATLTTGALLDIGNGCSRGPVVMAGSGPVAAQPLDPDVIAYLRGPGNKLDYFPRNFVANLHGRVKPWELSPEELAAAGLTQNTWTLDIISDQGTFLDRPRAKATNNAVTYAEVRDLAQQRPVRVLKSMVCLHGGNAANNGVWEGVALRDVLWLARPKGAIRRIAFHALQPKDQTQQEWCSSLPPARVFEAPPGMAPVMLALKFNGEWLTPRMGGPVRLIVHEHYGFKNTRHLRRVVFSRDHAATDDYARSGNDVESPVKSYAMQPAVYQRQPLMFGGQVLVGMSGLRMVQYALIPHDTDLPADDPFLQSLPWRDGHVLPVPLNFATAIPGGPQNVFGLSPEGTPLEWPIPGFTGYWVSPPMRDLKPGRYKLYARAVTRNGDAQPLPRPFDVSGLSRLNCFTFEYTPQGNIANPGRG